jgi:hypothetical protein
MKLTRTLLVVCVVALTATLLPAQDLRPTHETILFDANGKNMGAVVFGNNLRFRLDDGRSALLSILQAGTWNPRPIAYSGADCTGTAHTVVSSGVGQAAAAIGYDNILYVSSVGAVPADLPYASIRFGVSDCVNGAGTQTGSMPLSAYVDLDTLYAEPFSLAGPSAPATPTFADVPASSGLYEFVEMLSAAGVSGGCGGGNFCPNAPITRGQMAVFIAVSLGLRFRP